MVTISLGIVDAAEGFFSVRFFGSNSWVENDVEEVNDLCEIIMPVC